VRSKAGACALAAVAVTTVASVAFGACSDDKNPAPASAASGASSAFVTSTTVDVLHPPGGRLETAKRASGFGPGQCYTVDGFTAGQTLEPTQLHAIGCNAPHRLEVDAVLQHPSAPSISYPGDEAMAAFADDQCLEQFRGYVGRRYEDSNLDIADLRPTARSWNAGDRTFVCFVYDQDFNDLTGTVKGSAQ
jgi:hypothetical protein